MNTYKIFTTHRETPIIVIARQQEVERSLNTHFFKDDKDRVVAMINEEDIVGIVTEYAV